jgi:hypothetical protein
MNLHPEAQAQLTELLALLVNQGIRVVLTTHSPYIVDHIGNLVEASVLDEATKKTMASRFWLGTSDAFLDAEKVAAYRFQDTGECVEVSSIFERADRSIDWETFSEVSTRVSNLYGDLLRAQREAAE